MCTVFGWIIARRSIHKHQPKTEKQKFKFLIQVRELRLIIILKYHSTNKIIHFFNTQHFLFFNYNPDFFFFVFAPKSFINHSSYNFNARISTTYTNNKHFIEAIETINKGEEILIKYLTLEDSSEQMNFKLKQKYGFEEDVWLIVFLTKNEKKKKIGVVIEK